MIKINLAPSNIKNNDQQGLLKSLDLPREILIGLGGLVLTVLIAFHLLFLAGYVIELAKQIVYRVTWQGMLPDKKNIDSISQEMRELRSKIATINEVTAKKSVTWSQKFNLLSDQIPKGVWLTRILWDGKTLVLEGSAYSRFRDEINLVGNFVAALKKEESFMKDFVSVELSSVIRAKRASVEIVDYKVTAKAK